MFVCFIHHPMYLPGHLQHAGGIANPGSKTSPPPPPLNSSAHALHLATALSTYLLHRFALRYYYTITSKSRNNISNTRVCQIAGWALQFQAATRVMCDTLVNPLWLAIRYNSPELCGEYGCFHIDPSFRGTSRRTLMSRVYHVSNRNIHAKPLHSIQ